MPSDHRNAPEIQPYRDTGAARSHGYVRGRGRTGNDNALQSGGRDCAQLRHLMGWVRQDPNKTRMPSTGALHRKPELDLSGSPPPMLDRSANPELPATGRAEQAALVAITIDRADIALRVVSALHSLYPQPQITARTGTSRPAGTFETRVRSTPTRMPSKRARATALVTVGASAEHFDGLRQGVRDRGYDLVWDDSAQDPKAPPDAR